MASPGRREIRSLEKERLDTLIQDFIHDENVHVHVAVLYSKKSPPHQQKAREICDHLLSKRIRASLIDFEDNWLQYAKAEYVTHHVFVGFPAMKKPKRRRSVAQGTTPEEYYMDRARRKVSQVAVIQPHMPTAPSPQGHYLERFLQLDYEADSAWLAEAALALFAGASPMASEDDCAYWSAEPKLVVVRREEVTHLFGLSIMTRETAKESQFSRIVLIKGFNERCSDDLRERVGRYTHIQSVDGTFLDGMAIEMVTNVFQNLRHPLSQLVVRYIHPIKPDAGLLNALPNRSSTHIPRRRASRTNGDSHLLTPLFILGEHWQLQRALFDLLSSEDPVSSPAVEHSALSPNFSGSLHPAMSPMSTSEGNPLLPPKEDVLTPLEDVSKGLSAVRMRRGVYRELSDSDKCIERAEVPVNKFEVESSSLPDLKLSDAKAQPQPHPPKYGRQLSTRPPTERHQFVLHMLKKDVDRQFTHIFLKSSGIYLVVLGLDDVLGDPLIQYENLFYWLRLIQTHIRPDDLKRVIVVGMYRKSEVQERSDLILQCVQHLNAAIRDKMKQNFSLPTEEKGCVFMFNLDNAQTDLQYLCACIKGLMQVHIDQAWWYHREYFNSVFVPFEGYQKVCIEVSKLGKKKVVESSKNIKKIFGSPLPDKFFDSLAAYTTGRIDSKGDSLLRPSFIPELLTTFTRTMTFQEYQVHMVLPPFLKSLPIINSPLLSARMAELGVDDRKETDVVFEWLKRLEFAYSIGKVGAEKEKFFVPFLADETQSDNAFFRWEDSLEEEFKNCELVLYVLLHVPATEHFYHRLIASLLSDAVKSPHPQACYINRGCKGAILPLQYEERSSPPNSFLFQVLLNYYAVQNIIEVRARESKSKSLVLLKAVEAKLFDTFCSSKYHTVFDFKAAFSFHIPAADFEQALKDGPIWKLGSVGLATADDAEARDKPEAVLLKTKLLTDPRMKTWAASNPQMKELPTNLYLDLQKLLSTSDHYWTLVASKLNLLTVADINFYRMHPYNGGNGGIVLQRWKESTRLTFRDLVAALRAQDVGLELAADRVERHFLT